MAICGLCVWRSARNPVAALESVVNSVDAQKRVAPTPATEQLTARRQWRWVLLAFVPCSLMLSVTTYVTSEVAPIPLLWVVPLAIYLLAFILVFARRRWLPHRWMVRALPFAVVAVVYTLIGRVLGPIGLLIGLHLVGQFVISMVCLGELANDRPASEHLTEFYLWVSAGGVLGGMFNALLAPLIFSTVAEYPVTLVLACMMTPGRGASSSLPFRHKLKLDFALPVVIGLFTANLTDWLREATFWPLHSRRALMYGVPVVLCLLFVRRPLRFALSVACVFVACRLVPGYQDRTLCVERSFFGINRISLDPAAGSIGCRTVIPSTAFRTSIRTVTREPLGYFTRTGPFGQAFAALDSALKQRVGVIGLGAGSLACYGTRGEQWTFFEIDPVVEGIARDPGFFTFLKDCPANVDVVLGDARLSLQKADDGQFGVLVLDAYSSDTIPLHLITKEALALYLRKLAPDGALIFHISNRHLRLERVLGVLAEDAGLACLIEADNSNSLLSTGQARFKMGGHGASRVDSGTVNVRCALGSAAARAEDEIVDRRLCQRLQRVCVAVRWTCSPSAYMP